jgi:membrane-bound lytic murein transglycosylase D
MDITGETHWYVLKFLAHLIAYNDELGISTPNKILTDYTQGAKKTLLEIAKENKTTVKDIAPHNQWLRTSAVPAGKQFSVIVIRK